MSVDLENQHIQVAADILEGGTQTEVAALQEEEMQTE
jgi:hypothetical protein